MSGSVLSAGYTKMPTTASQGLTGPMRRVKEAAGACLTCSENKRVVLERTAAHLYSAGLFTQLHRAPGLVQRALVSRREEEGLDLHPRM